MNITFLIGNGFDIGMGLKSRYSDYFSQYIEESKEKNITLKELSKVIEKSLKNPKSEINWADFETALGKYTRNFNQETKNDLIAQIRDFELGFSAYLQKEQKQLEYDKDKVCKFFLSALKSFYLNGNLAPASEEDIKNAFAFYKQGNHIYNFISFNYTEVLQKCIGYIPDGKIGERKVNSTQCIDRIGSLIYVHGKLGNNPIMGVNDESQIENQELATDSLISSCLIKPINNKTRRRISDKNATELISQSQIICIYGMSLGETDKKWWQLIIKWLGGDAHRQLIIYLWNDKFDDSTQFDWIIKENEIMDTLKGYNQDDKIDVETLRPRIHIAIHKNIFALNLRKPDDNEPTAEDNEFDKRDAV